MNANPTTDAESPRPRPRRRTLAAAVVTLAAPVLLGGMLAGAASAAVPGLVRVTASTPTDSNFSHQANVACPAGKKLLSAGGATTGGAGQVLISEITPDFPASNTRVTAFEDDNGTGLNWSTTAFAMCADPLPNLAQFAFTSPDTTSSAAKTATVNCPTGRSVIGGGARIVGAQGQTVIDRITPNAGLTSVTAHAVEDVNGTAAAWSLTAFAVCADKPAGLELRSNTLTVPPGVNTTATSTVACSPGKEVLGTFGEILNGQGRALITRVAPFSNRKGSEFAATTVGGTSPAGNWSTVATAVCATP